MTDYQIQPNTRRCATTGRELRPGEKFYTALLAEGDHFLRKDYSSEAWHGPPPGAFSFWSGRVPAAESGKRQQIDDDMLVDCFQRLETETQAAKVNFRFVVALLLMRRKRFKFEEARTEHGLEMLTLRCVRSGVRHEVVNPRLTEEQMTEVQDEVYKVLGWE